MFSNHSHKVDFQLSNHLNHSRNTGLIVYFNFETNMQADLSVYTRPSLTRSQHYESQLNCHTQIYFLHSLTSSNGLFRKQPVFLVPAVDQSIHSVHALHAAFLFLPLKDSHSPLAPGRPLKRGKFYRHWLSKSIIPPLNYSGSNVAFHYAFIGTWNKHLVG